MGGHDVRVLPGLKVADPLVSLVKPARTVGDRDSTRYFSARDVMTFLGLGGTFVAVFVWLTRRSALLPIKDPRLPESLGFENA